MNLVSKLKQCYSAINVAEMQNIVTNYNWVETLKDKTLVAFGLGKFMEDTHERLFNMLDITYLTDNNSKLWGGVRYNKPIISPSELNNINNVFVIIVMGNPLPVKKQLKDMGVDCVCISELHFSYYEKGRDLSWLKAAMPKIETALGVLQDDKSREIFTHIFCNKLSSEHSKTPYASFSESGEYFANGLWQLNEHESFLDGGAYIGDTVDEFIKATNGRFDNIYSFEYEVSNYRKLHERVQSLYPDHIDKIHVFNKGIWDKNEAGYCAYFGESDGTQIVERADNAQQVDLVAIDDFLVNKHISVIKFDIEGAEMNGIVGARKIIAEQKPKLAICLYHRPEDLWEIPCLIHEINPKYRMIIKHHSTTNYTDTVLYAM